MRMAGPLIAFAIFCLVLTVLGIAWYRSDPVSAGRPGSLLVIVGILGIGAAWWVS